MPGNFHPLAWTDAGELFTWGWGRVGQLGHGSSMNNERVPRRVEASLIGAKVVGVSCGMYHTMVIADDGALYSFGEGAFTALGHGSTNSELTPRNQCSTRLRQPATL